LARIDFESLAAAVFHREGRLQQENAAFRVRYDDAPAFRTLDNLRMIEYRIEAEQAQPKPTASVLRTVTRTLVAPGFGQHRQDLADKVRRHFGLREFHRHRN